MEVRMDKPYGVKINLNSRLLCKCTECDKDFEFPEEGVRYDAMKGENKLC
jgi:hypothetical protein